MRRLTCVIAGWGFVLGLGSSGCIAAEGQGLLAAQDAAAWSTWQGRLSLGNSNFWRSSLLDADANRTPSMSLMGDYYFTRSLLGNNLRGGFRATSGLIFGPRTQTLTGQPGLGAGNSFSLGNRLLGTASTQLPATRDASTDTATQTYLGLGYTGLSARGGWSFSADLGVVAQSASSAIRFGRTFGSSGQNLDDLVRDLRMTPVFQLGVSYAF